MLCSSNKIKFAFHHISVSGKRGFTLIETMLAIGLLVILVVIVSQGFISTLQLSTNTVLFEKAGELDAGMVNNKIASATGNPAVSPSVAIHLESPAFSKNLGVFTYEVTGTPNTNYGVDSYKESGYASTNRSGFYYCGKALTS